MDSKISDLEDKVRALSQQVEELTRRMAEMERRSAERQEDLRYRIFMLATGKISNPRTPYFAWLLERDRGDETSTQVNALFTVLEERLTGADVTDFYRDQVKDAPHELLHGSDPPAAADVIAAIKRVVRIDGTHDLRELIRAIREQTGHYPTLCALVLDEIGE